MDDEKITCTIWFATILFCLLSVVYLSELCVAIVLTDIIVFNQLTYIIFFGVHTNYLCYLGKNDTLNKIL